MKDFLVCFVLAFVVVFGGLNLVGCGPADPPWQPLPRDGGVRTECDGSVLTDEQVLLAGIGDCEEMIAAYEMVCPMERIEPDVCVTSVRAQNGVACMDDTSVTVMRDCMACIHSFGDYCPVEDSQGTPAEAACAALCPDSTPECLPVP
jgi:hypothetical protein